MVREVVAMMLDDLKFPSWLEGDLEGAIIDGIGGRNDAAIAAIEEIIVSSYQPMTGSALIINVLTWRHAPGGALCPNDETSHAFA